MNGFARIVAFSVLIFLVVSVPALWATWVDDGVAICTATGDQYRPFVASDGAGGAIVTWWDTRSGNYDIYAQQINASGAAQWTADGVALCTATDNQYDPRITSDNAGGAIVTWHDDRKEIDQCDIYAQRVDVSGAVIWTSNGVPICIEDGHQSWPEIISDGAGGAIVTWNDERTPPGYHIYAQRVNALGVVQWANNGIAICAASGYQYHPKITPDGSGGAIITWMDSRSGNYNIYAQRVDGSGIVQWTANGVAICTAIIPVQFLKIISDGTGGAIIAWEDLRNSNLDIFAQRVNASGTTEWTANGVAICTSVRNQVGPSIASDGANGVIIAWQDDRPVNMEDDIYAQRVDSNGNVIWASDGIPICSSSKFQVTPDISSDGSGGAIIAWSDSRNGTYEVDDDIYAQRVDASGNALWTLDGTPICTAAGWQRRAQIVLDGGGGAVIAWEDSRSGNWDIYAQRIGPEGSMHTIYVDPQYTLTNCETEPTVSFRVDQTGMPQNIRGYEIKFSVSPSVATVADPGTNIVEGSYLSSIGTTMFSAMSAGGGNYSVTCAILGGTTGATGDGELFTVKLTPAATGTSDIAITSIKLRDLDNNFLTTVGENGSISVDCTPPAPPTNFVSMPGHNKTHLTWTNPTGDPTFVGVEIRLTPWSSYPEYLAPAPEYPASHTEGTYATLATGESYDDSPRTPRDIYYYAAFSKDLAGNYSAASSGARDRTTSYWLGDVDAAFDGLVNMNDLIVFSATFGRNEGETGWDNDCDFGPTDDWSRFGVPLPDNAVDFEDLMVFSMNWGRVIPAGMNLVAGVHVDEDLEKLVEFELVPVPGENALSIVMTNHAETLKGVHIVVTCAGSEVVGVKRGTLLAGHSDVFFGRLPSEQGSINICVAALGVDKPLAKASGEVAKVELGRSGEEPVSLSITAVDLRDVDNTKHEIAISEEYEAPFVPEATALMQNYPNPFNPTTAFTYDLAAAGHVAIRVYDVTGRCLRTFVDTRKEIGRHRVEWDGKDASGAALPSGIYFCRMQTSSFEATRKMILMR